MTSLDRNSPLEMFCSNKWMMWALLVVTLTFTCSLGVVNGDVVNISNTAVRRDIDGNVMDVHDGSIHFSNGKWWWVGMGYGDCIYPKYWDCSPAVTGYPRALCGFQSNHTLSAYSSPDMKHWKFEGDALPFESRPFGIYFRYNIQYFSNSDSFRPFPYLRSDLYSDPRWCSTRRRSCGSSGSTKYRTKSTVF